MRTLLALAAVAATAALPATAGAEQRPDIPGTCDLVKNTMCHVIPPDSAEDVCVILDNTFIGCEISRRS